MSQSGVIQGVTISKEDFNFWDFLHAQEHYIKHLKKME